MRGQGEEGVRYLDEFAIVVVVLEVVHLHVAHGDVVVHVDVLELLRVARGSKPHGDQTPKVATTNREGCSVSQWRIGANSFTCP